MEDLNLIIGRNISEFRKKNNMTQLDLAEKINYSDKSISKWEKGDGVPDIYVLKTLADIFNVTVNDLISVHDEGKIKAVINKNKRSIIIVLSILIVWLVAVIAFVILKWVTSIEKCWLSFIFAFPISFIVGLVLCKLWKRKIYRAICCSGIVWGTIISFCLTFSFEDVFMATLVGIPLQIMIILWYVYIVKDKNKISKGIITIEKNTTNENITTN